jgi:hypothetical protein
VLGLVVDGCSNQAIARELVVAPRTVAAHMEHILVKLQAQSRTLAAVRAEREGLYVPYLRWPAGRPVRATRGDGVPERRALHDPSPPSMAATGNM